MPIVADWNVISKAVSAIPKPEGIWASIQALGGVGTFALGAKAWSDCTDRFMRFDPDHHRPTVSQVSQTFVRTLIVPSLAEELFWRVLLQPPSIHWSRVIVCNVLFAAYHYHGSVILAETLDDHKGARSVFRDPAFLTLAFVLGNACSFAYVRSGYALWAPVLVHAVSVTVWLSFLSGDKALSTAHGLSVPKPSLKQQDPQPSEHKKRPTR